MSDLDPQNPDQKTPSTHERVLILEARLDGLLELIRRSQIQNAKSKQKFSDELNRVPKSRLINALIEHLKQSRRADLQLVSYTSQETGLRDHRGNLKEPIDWAKKLRKSGNS